MFVLLHVENVFYFGYLIKAHKHDILNYYLARMKKIFHLFKNL